MLNFLTIFLIAVGLSMDTFSLSIIYGTFGISRKNIYLLSVIVGVYHFFMPYFGNLIGYNFINKLPISSDFLVGIIFIVIALQMLYQKEDIISLSTLWAFFVFGFTVSLDSFSVGIGISSITSKFLISYIIFAFVSFIFTFLGLRFGEGLNNKFGHIANKIGAIILISLGILYIF